MPLFDAWPDRYAAWFRSPIGRLVYDVELALLRDLLEIQPGARVLDAGCGSGLFSAPLLEYGAHLVGLDPSRPMLEAARAVLPETYFVPVAGDLRTLPFIDACFDVSVSITALEFIAEGQRAVDELFRVTRPGGQVVVATLNRLGSWGERRTAAARRDPDSLFRHAQLRTPDELAALAPVRGVVRTAVHFARETPPGEAMAIERAAAACGLPSGAFVVGAWRKA
jgi:SAM-dependent methyltransferase